MNAAVPKDESLMGQIKRAETLMSSGQLVEARPLLRKLRSNPEVDAKVHSTLDFNIALSYVFEYYDANQESALGEALKLFEEFIKQYPGHSLTSVARYNMGDLYAISKQFKEALKVYIPLYNNPVPGIKKSEVLKKIIFIYILEDKWVAGAPYFEAGIRIAENSEERTTYAAYLLIAKAKQGDVSDSRQILEFFGSTSPVFYTPRFNASLMEVGDQLRNDGDLATASLFYQFVRKYETLQIGLNRYIRVLERKLAQYEDNPVLRNFYVQTKTELDNAMADLAALEASSNYTPLLNWRIASVYMDMGRDWEAFWRFRLMVDTYPDHEYAEDILFSSYSLARKLGVSEEKLDLSERYLETSEFTRYRGTVADEITTDYLAEENYEKVYELTRWYLPIAADSPAASLLVFKYGMARLSRYETPDLIDDFTDFRAKYGSTKCALVINYFLGLAHLTEEHHQEALELFDEVIAHPNTRFRADASFRRALCVMGLDRLEEARDLIVQFIDKYPDNALRAQAELVLGNLLYLFGDAAGALTHYYLIEKHTDELGLIATGHLKIARILFEQGDVDPAIERLAGFIEANPEAPEIIPVVAELANFYGELEQPRVGLNTVKGPLQQFFAMTEVDELDTLLVDYLGKDRALREMRTATEAFLDLVESSPNTLKELIMDRGKQYRYFKENPEIDALVQYSFVKDNAFRKEISDHFKAIDKAHAERVAEFVAANPDAPKPEQEPYAVVEFQVLKDLSSEINELNQMIPTQTADDWLQAELSKAKAEGNVPLSVRILAALAATEDPEGWPAPELVALVGNEELWPQIGVAGKLWILKTYADLKPAEVIVFFDDSRVEFMNTSAELGMHVLKADCYQREGQIPEAIEANKTLIKRFASAEEACTASLEIGRMEIAQGNFQEARDELEVILHRNEWRGQRHGDALLWIGRAYVAEDKLSEAHGFFERIMLGYPGFNELLGTAYHEDILVLKAMGELASAKMVYEAFKETPGLDETEAADLIRKEFE